VTGPRMEDRLRDALAARAGTVQPAPDALPAIRTRIAARRGRRRRTLLAATATLATSMAAVTGVVVLRDAGGPPPGHLDAAASPSAVASNEAAPTARLPVYWVGDGRLYREYRTLPVAGGTLADKVAAAATEAISGTPLDPDYRTGWPSGVTVRGVRTAATTVTVDLAGLSVDARNPSAAAAVRQLVWTVTAVSNLPAVRLLVNGAQVDTLWSEVPVGSTLRRADADVVLAPVWLISPQQGDTVGSAFDVQVAGFVPDGRVRVTLRDAAGATVVSQEAVLDDVDPHQGEAWVHVALPQDGYAPGTATLSVAPVNAAGAVDDHVVTLSS
jgi:hypothetical protein